MTIVDDHQLADWSDFCARPLIGGQGPSRRVHRPVAMRPAFTPLQHRRHHIAVSKAPHRRPANRPVSTAATIALAGLAALITVWLGMLAQAAADRTSAPTAAPERLAVVQVLAGETLQQLAGRVSPESPVDQVAERIRDLNELEATVIEAGQTLIAPVG